jgi:transcriptional regulator of acetoin/glycerol metabolism
LGHRKYQAPLFRKDLFFRIQGACVSPPPLRERSDRVWLAKQLLSVQAELTATAEDYIARYDWPGNVRELKSALLQAQALAPSAVIDREHFSQPLLPCSPAPPPAAAPASTSRPVRTRTMLLREAVDEAMRVSNGNLSEAARRLHMARSTLYRILRREPPDDKETS